MILEALRLVTAALDDGSSGVNAKLAAMETAGEFGSDPTPPDLVGVLDPTQDDALAKGVAPPDWPVLLVTSPAASEMEGTRNQTKRDATRAPISLAYVTRDSDGAEATRNALYTMRAVLKALATWIEGGGASLTKNGVQVLNITDISFGEINERFEDGATARGALLAALSVRDTSAT